MGLAGGWGDGDRKQRNEPQPPGGRAGRSATHVCCLPVSWEVSRPEMFTFEAHVFSALGPLDAKVSTTVTENRRKGRICSLSRHYLKAVTVTP